MASGSVGVALACVMTVLPALASGQDHARDSGAGVEVTPYVALGSATSWGGGAAVRWPLPGDLSLEVDTSYRQAEIRALSASVNLLFDVAQLGRVTPYVATGIGLDQYGTPLVTPDGVVAQGRTGVAVNAGGGVRVRGNERWGLRTDARWINGLGRASGERWRLYNGLTFRSLAR